MTRTQIIISVAWSIWLTLFAGGVVGPSARAQDAEPAFDVLVRTDHPVDGMLLDRVRGQTSDLNVLLLADSSRPIESTLPAQLETARALSEAQHTRVVVWFAHDSEWLTVFVAEPAAGRVLVRRIAPSEGRLGGSAQQESAALVVRSALRALAAGGEIGVTEQEATPPPPPVVVEKPKAPPPAPKPRPERWQLAQSIGARSAYDGAGKNGQHALFGRLTVQRERWQAELRAAFGFGVRLDDSLARVALRRHAASLHAAYLPWRNRRFALSTALGAGANLFLTEVAGRSVDFAEDESALFVPVASADATLRFVPDWAKQRLGVGCLIGADVLPQAVVVGYETPEGRFVARDRIWHVLPTLALELVVRLN